jgi:hypothetical protein
MGGMWRACLLVLGASRLGHIGAEDNWKTPSSSAIVLFFGTDRATRGSHPEAATDGEDDAMDTKTGSFQALDRRNGRHTIDEYHDLMASGARGMKHYVLGDGRKVTHLGQDRYIIDETREVLTRDGPPEEGGA